MCVCVCVGGKVCSHVCVCVCVVVDCVDVCVCVLLPSKQLSYRQCITSRFDAMITNQQILYKAGLNHADGITKWPQP